MEHPLSQFLWRFAGVMGLVFLNGFFVAAEFAIITVRKTRLDQLIEEGNRRALVVRRAASDPASYIAATQLGITMTSLALGWVGEPAIAEFVHPAITFLPAHIADPLYWYNHATGRYERLDAPAYDAIVSGRVKNECIGLAVCACHCLLHETQNAASVIDCRKA